jgi:hypothetical protein
MMPGSFAADEIVNAVTGLDDSKKPTEVITTVQTFITEKLDASAVGVSS